MKRVLLIFCILLMTPVTFASESSTLSFNIFNNDSRAIKSLLNSQVRYANRNNFKKFIATYDKDYCNADGFKLDTYSDIVKDIWGTYDKIKYEISINDVIVNEDLAEVKVTEYSSADMPISSNMGGKLNSVANSIYYLKKRDGRWKVYSDKVIDENTSMLYGDAQDIDINLTAPKEITAGVEYTASLDFTPPENVLAVASIVKDKVEYPQKQPEEVYRKLPENNLLERLFVSNSDNMNEYVIATIGLTKADIDDLSISLSLTGFGYKIVRVNVIPENRVVEHVKNK